MPHDGMSKPFSGFCVAKDDLHRWRWEEHGTAEGNHLSQGQIVVDIDKFAFTANNVTYARLGDQIPYWRFFPAPEGWGYIPVWGIGNVTRSLLPEVNEGERVYGYFPMATHLLMQPGGLRGARMIDAAAPSQARDLLVEPNRAEVLIDVVARPDLPALDVRVVGHDPPPPQ